MKLRDKIVNDLTQALKAKEQQKVSVLRYLFSQIKDLEIDKKRTQLKDEEIVKLINNQIKKLKESIGFFEKGKREDLIANANQEIKILQTYLPKQMDEKILAEKIDQIIKEHPEITQPGPLIGMAVKALSGQVDNQKISQLILDKFKK